jgi:diguanylate cyclase (GGDEF)-like protein
MPRSASRPPGIWPDSRSYATRWIVLAVAVVMTLVVGFAAYHYDRLMQDNLPLTPLYLTPVIFCAWFGRRLQAFLITLVAGATLWFATHEFAPSLPVQVTMVALQFVTYNMVGMMVLYLRSMHFVAFSQARTDSLTGLRNGLGFNDLAMKELQRLGRYHRPLGALYLDVDNFKKVNDAFGHTAGDRALQIVAEAIRSSTRAVDVPARLGGDEFIVLLPETDDDGLKHVAAKLSEQITIMSMGKLSCSIGGVLFKEPPLSVDLLIQEVDDVMYRAKIAGKAQAVFAQAGPGMQPGPDGGTGRRA